MFEEVGAMVHEGRWKVSGWQLCHPFLPPIFTWVWRTKLRSSGLGSKRLYVRSHLAGSEKSILKNSRHCYSAANNTKPIRVSCAAISRVCMRSLYSEQAGLSQTRVSWKRRARSSRKVIALTQALTQSLTWGSNTEVRSFALVRTDSRSAIHTLELSAGSDWHRHRSSVCNYMIARLFFSGSVDPGTRFLWEQVFNKQLLQKSLSWALPGGYLEERRIFNLRDNGWDLSHLCEARSWSFSPICAWCVGYSFALSVFSLVYNQSHTAAMPLCIFFTCFLGYI